MAWRRARARAGAVREHSAFQRGGARVRRGTRRWAQSTCHCAQLLLRKPRSELPWLSGSAVQRTTGWTSSPGVTYSDILARVHHCGLPGGHGAGVSPAVLSMSLPPWVGVGVGTGPPWGPCVTRALCLPLRKRPIENRWEKLSEKETKSDTRYREANRAELALSRRVSHGSVRGINEHPAWLPGAAEPWLVATRCLETVGSHGFHTRFSPFTCLTAILGALNQMHLAGNCPLLREEMRRPHRARRSGREETGRSLQARPFPGSWAAGLTPAPGGA